LVERRAICVASRLFERRAVEVDPTATATRAGASLSLARGIATVAILGAVEDCGPDGDCNISSSPSGVMQFR